jgi:hypothetical protein
MAFRRDSFSHEKGSRSLNKGWLKVLLFALQQRVGPVYPICHDELDPVDVYLSTLVSACFVFLISPIFLFPLYLFLSRCYSPVSDPVPPAKNPGEVEERLGLRQMASAMIPNIHPCWSMKHRMIADLCTCAVIVLSDVEASRMTVTSDRSGEVGCSAEMTLPVRTEMKPSVGCM